MSSADLIAIFVPLGIFFAGALAAVAAWGVRQALGNLLEAIRDLEVGFRTAGLEREDLRIRIVAIEVYLWGPGTEEQRRRRAVTVAKKLRERVDVEDTSPTMVRDVLQSEARPLEEEPGLGGLDEEAGG